jgi:hypothetical protein
VEKHNIPEDKCLYMKNDKIYTKKYCPADLFIDEQYANANILNKDVFLKKKENEQIEKNNEKVDEVKSNEEHTLEKRMKRKQYDENNITDAPPIVFLEENEMFKNEHGEPMDIEVRGEKTQHGAFFNAYDLGKAFNYSKLKDVVVDPRSFHVYGKDYIYFTGNSDGKVKVKVEGKKKVLHLTYMGVLKVLFSARGNKAERFQEWATRILFTMQMGKQDDKDMVASEALNVDVSTITQLFRKSSRAIPCVYLFEVGTVGHMRQHFNMGDYKNDDDKVYKYGMTCDMARRANEHVKTYGKLKDNSFGLTVFSYIDVAFMSKAENNLKHSFENMNVRIEDTKHNELVVIKKDRLPYIKSLFNDMYTCYSGNNRDLIQQIQEMQINHQRIMEKNEYERCIDKSDCERLVEKKDHTIVVLKMDNEYLQLKHKSELQEVELMYFRKTCKTEHSY